MSRRKMMFTAPSGPITATSAWGHAKLKSASMCFELMTSYAPPYALRVALVDLEELAVVDDQRHDVAHVVRLGRAIRDDAVERLVHAVRVVARLDARRRLEVVLGEERHEVAHVLKALLLVVLGEVGHA